MNKKKFLWTLFRVIAFFIFWAFAVTVGEYNSPNPAVARLYDELFPLLWTVVFTTLFWWVDRKKIVLPVLKDPAKGLFLGTLSGAVWLCAVAGILVGTRVAGLTPNGEVQSLSLWILAACLNVFMQELLIRGYIYQYLNYAYGVPAAAVVTTLLFTFMHGGAFEAGPVAVLNVITCNLFLTALYEYSGALMAPAVAHTIWNILGGILLGGVSLAEDYPSLYTMIASPNLPEWLTGGSALMEGSGITLVVNLILFAVFLLLEEVRLQKDRTPKRKK